MESCGGRERAIIEVDGPCGGEGMVDVVHPDFGIRGSKVVHPSAILPPVAAYPLRAKQFSFGDVLRVLSEPT